MCKDELELVNKVKEHILNQKQRYCCNHCKVDGYCPTYDCGNLDRIKAYTDRQWLNTIKKTQRTYEFDLTFEELVDEVYYDIWFKRPRGK
jgi:hypothetical protein